jgi:hypothetical protein
LFFFFFLADVLTVHVKNSSSLQKVAIWWAIVASVATVGFAAVMAVGTGFAYRTGGSQSRCDFCVSVQQNVHPLVVFFFSPPLLLLVFCYCPMLWRKRRQSHQRNAGTQTESGDGESGAHSNFTRVFRPATAPPPLLLLPAVATSSRTTSLSAPFTTRRPRRTNSAAPSPPQPLMMLHAPPASLHQHYLQPSGQAATTTVLLPLLSPPVQQDSPLSTEL